MPDEQQSYLQSLSLKPELERSAIAGYLRNLRIPVLIVITVILAGIFGYINLPRRVNPEVKIPIVFVSTVYPGANPQDVEQLVTKELETPILGLEKVNQVTSSSRENISTIVVEFESTVDPQKAKEDVQSAVDTVTGLPEEVNQSNVAALDFEDVPAWMFTVTGNTDPVTLFHFAKDLQKELEDIPSINKVFVSGLEDSEIRIELSPEKMKELGLQPMQLSQAISAQLKAYPAGVVETGSALLSLSIDPTVTNLETLRDTQITLNQNTYTLGEIADVYETSVPNQPKSFYGDQNKNIQRAVTFSVYKVSSANVDQAARTAKEVAHKFTKDHDGRFQLIDLIDFDKEITDQFVDLFSDFRASIALVFFTLFIFLGLRQAFLASIVIPISFLFTFAVMQATGQTMSFIAVFSLLLAQGMIVDDTIVIISAMTDYYKTGKFTPHQTALLVWNDFIIPILTSNLTNIWSFLPLLLATGIIGEFIKILPTVVIIALIGSTAIALLVTLPLMAVVLNPKIPRRVIRLLGLIAGVIGVVIVISISKGNPLLALIVIAYILAFVLGIWLKKKITKPVVIRLKESKRWHDIRTKSKPIIFRGMVNLDPLWKRYQSILRRVLVSKRSRRLVIIGVIIFSLFSYILVPLGLVQNVFFPDIDQNMFNIEVQLPTGTNLDKTTAEAERLANELRTKPHIQSVITDVGSSSSMGSINRQNDFSKILFTVILDEDDRKRPSSMDITQSLREEYKNYNAGTFSVIEASAGPPTGAELQIKYLGDDLGVLEQLADNTIEYLKTQAGVINIEKSAKPSPSKIVFIPNQSELLVAGISTTQVFMALRSFTNGFDIDQAKFSEDIEGLPIVLRLSEGYQTPAELGKLEITSPNGSSIPLLQLGKLELRANPSLIAREDGKRTISVSAALEKGFNPTVLGRQLELYADTKLALPEGYSWKTGGLNEENQRSVNSILQSMLLAGLLIMATMVLQLQSFRKAFIVMLVIPLAISGVFILFALTGTPLSFPALIGILALFGIVVKNSILVVDKINLNLTNGLNFNDAVVDGAASRLEPILFSSITNFIGLLPITLSDPLWRGLGGAIIAGLTFSGTIMLLFIPVVYYIWFKPGKSKVV